MKLLLRSCPCSLSSPTLMLGSEDDQKCKKPVMLRIRVRMHSAGAWEARRDLQHGAL